MDLAKAKLLDGPLTLNKNRLGSLACLSVRFALEFNTDGSDGHRAGYITSCSVTEQLVT
jgi:hypothetical protein